MTVTMCQGLESRRFSRREGGKLGGNFMKWNLLRLEMTNRGWKWERWVKNQMCKMQELEDWGEYKGELKWMVFRKIGKFRLKIVWRSNVPQRFKTYMKVKAYTGAVVISLHCKHNMFTHISVSHKHTAKHCIISQFHTNIKATAPY